MQRCAWVTTDPSYCDYHDHEWARPLYDEQRLFEMLVLEGFQAGLSWLTILKKRPQFRIAFDNFEPEKVASFDAEKQKVLMANPAIVRNQRKIQAAVINARAFLELQEQKGSFAHYLWSFVDHQPIINSWSTQADVPARTALSEAISKDLKGRGFSFVGPTIIYAYMQAVGLVWDHTVDCFCYQEVHR